MADTREERNAKQRARQVKLREQRRTDRKPGRDDVARAMLYVVIKSALAGSKGDAKEARRTLAGLEDAMTAELVSQGYSEIAAQQEFDEIFARQRAGWGFRRKLHLLEEPPEDADD